MSHDERAKLANAITMLTISLERMKVDGRRAEVCLAIIEEIEEHEKALLRVDQRMRRALFEQKKVG